MTIANRQGDNLMAAQRHTPRGRSRSASGGAELHCARWQRTNSHHVAGPRNHSPSSECRSAAAAPCSHPGGGSSSRNE